MSILSFLTSAFKPAADLVDNLHTSKEEKLDLQNQLEVIQNELKTKFLDYEHALLSTKKTIVTAEAKGGSWLQRNWRPITMLTFLVLVVCDCFGLLAFRLADQAWILLQIGLGGYVVGRSAEKITPAIVQSIKGRARH